MTPDDFRRIALSQAGAADGMVKLTPDQQEMLVAAEPGVFVAAKGGEGRLIFSLLSCLVPFVKVVSVHVEHDQDVSINRG